jgi:hypothetical protein
VCVYAYKMQLSRVDRMCSTFNRVPSESQEVLDCQHTSPMYTSISSTRHTLVSCSLTAHHRHSLHTTSSEAHTAIYISHTITHHIIHSTTSRTVTRPEVARQLCSCAAVHCT